MNNITAEEVWKPIKGFDGYYAASSLGRIQSLTRRIERNNGTGERRIMKGQVIKQIPDPYGYLRVSLSKNGISKQYLVHRLIAEAFIPNPDNLPQVNHMDEVKSNNSILNLEWCDNEYNTNYGTAHDSKKKPIKATHIKTGKITTFDSMMDAQRNGFQQANISKVCRGERQSHKGYKWEYID